MDEDLRAYLCKSAVSITVNLKLKSDWLYPLFYFIYCKLPFLFAVVLFMNYYVSNLGQ